MRHLYAKRKALMVVAGLLLLCAVVAACGKTSGNETTSESTSGGGGGEEAAPAESSAAPLSDIESAEGITIGFSNYAAVIPFYQAMIAGVEDEAKKLGWSVDVTDSKF